MDPYEIIRQRIGALTPLEKAQKESDEHSVLYFKSQLELLEDQKKYTKAIKWASIVMAIATGVIAVATVLQYLYPLK